MAEGGIGVESAISTERENKSSVIQKKGEPSLSQQEEIIERQRFSIPIIDTRDQSFTEQTEAFKRRLTEDKIDLALLQTRQFLGEYGDRDARDLAIKVIPGKRIGAGQVTDKLIDLEMPTPYQIEEIRQKPHPILSVLSVEQYNSLAMAIFSSTALHEGVHGLLNSRPDSQFAVDLEKISRISNQYGQVATLLDEGIAYAVQGLYAPSAEPIGSLAPQINPGDSFMEQTRKTLGKRLSSILTEYITNGKSLDTVFLAQAGDILKQIDVQRYIDDYEKNISLKADKIQ